MVAAGDPTDSSDITNIEDYTIRKPIVRLLQITAQSMTTATDIAITFAAGSEEIDTNGFHDETTNNTRITPNVAGYYRLSGAYCTVNGASTITAISVAFTKNGTTLSPMFRFNPASGVGTRSVIAEPIIVSANGTSDYFTLIGQQVSGGSLLTSVAAPFQSTFECEFIRPL